MRVFHIATAASGIPFGPWWWLACLDQPQGSFLLCRVLRQHMFWLATSYCVSVLANQICDRLCTWLSETYFYVSRSVWSYKKKQLPEKVMSWVASGSCSPEQLICLQKSWSRRLAVSWSLVNLQRDRLKHSLSGLVYASQFSSIRRILFRSRESCSGTSYSRKQCFLPSLIFGY